MRGETRSFSLSLLSSPSFPFFPLLSFLSDTERPERERIREREEADHERERERERERLELRVKSGEARRRPDRRSNFRWSQRTHQTQEDPKPKRTGVETGPSDKTQTQSAMGHHW